MDFDEKIDQILLLMEETKGSYSKIISDLDELNIPYWVVGGMAVSYHGWDRFTKDIDILMNYEDFMSIPDSENFQINKDKEAFGKMVHNGTGVRIDVLFGGKIFPRVENLSGSDHVVSLEDLIWLKTIRGDPSDFGDIYRITKGKKVDLAYLKKVIDIKKWNELISVLIKSGAIEEKSFPLSAGDR